MILGLHGKMGAGKNEIARRLRVVHNVNVVEVSYAAKLKQSVAALLGCTLEDIECWKNDPAAYVKVSAGRGRTEQTFRSFLQRYGTEAHRDVFGADFWLDAALPIHGDYTDALYVVTDVRFPNEKHRIEWLGGEVIRVIGPNEDTGGHVSERPLECDTMIDNTVRDDGFARLDEQLRALVSRPLRAAA